MLFRSFASKKALEIKDKTLVYTCDPSCWTEKPYDYAAVSAYRMGLFEEAKSLGQMALSFNPNDDRLKKNLEFYSTGE